MTQSAAELQHSADNQHLRLLCTDYKTPMQKCGVHGSDSFPKLLSGVACQGNVISIQQNPH